MKTVDPEALGAGDPRRSAHDLAAMRREYVLAALDESHVDRDPIVQFRRWFDEAVNARVEEPTAMALASATRDGAPSVRIVLLKGLDARGFSFFTDYRSRKGLELDLNPHAALCFLWKELERQVRVEGRVERISAADSDEYYRSRPLGARLGAWASNQSTVIGSRKSLEDDVQRATERFGDDPPRPEHWGGYRVVPERVEFWQGRESRLHDRLVFVRSGADWALQRLSP